MCNKSFPIKVKSHQSIFTIGIRWFNFFKAIEMLGPETSPIFMIELINGLITLLEKFLEVFLAFVAIADSLKFIGDMP